MPFRDLTCYPQRILLHVVKPAHQIFLGGKIPKAAEEGATRLLRIFVGSVFRSVQLLHARRICNYEFSRGQYRDIVVPLAY
jgi:hypothetical protein